MEANWNACDGFEALIAKINKGIIVTDITGHPIKPSEVVDVAIRVAMQSGISATTYKAWYQHAANQKNWIDSQSFWGK